MTHAYVIVCDTFTVLQEELLLSTLVTKTAVIKATLPKPLSFLYTAIDYCTPIMASSLSSEEIYAAMGQAVETDETMRKKFKACVVFDLGQDGVWCLNTKEGTLTKGSENENADLTVTTTLAVFQDLLRKKLTPQQAFMKGKLKIKGNMSLAMKLTVVVSATRQCLPGLAKL